MENNNNNNSLQNNNNIKTEEDSPKDENKNEIVDTNLNNKDTQKEEQREKQINKNKKYRMKFSVTISKLRESSDDAEIIGFNEFITNLLLMSSQINPTNKISCLTLLSYTNFVLPFLKSFKILLIIISCIIFPPISEFY